MNINVTNASKIFGVSRQTIYAMQQRGELPPTITELVVMQYLDDKNKELNRTQIRLGEHMADRLKADA